MRRRRFVLPPTDGSSSSWPDATNTGVPSGTSLTSSGTLNTSANNQIIDALNITGSLTIDHTGVLVKRCKITASNSNIVVVNATGCTIQDCEIDGNLTGSTGILVRHGVQALRLNIHGCENGGNAEINSSGAPALFQDCWVHDLSLEGSGFHTDGMQFDPDAAYITFEHNSWQPIPSGIRNATSCINFNNEAIGTNNHITVNNNKIDGRGCGSAMYLPRYSGWSNLVITNNRMRPGDNGYSSNGGGGTGTFQTMTTWSGNVDDGTGATVNQAD
jgi:hypothetical protein